MIARDQIRIRDPFVLPLPTGAFVMYGSTDPNPWDGPGTGFDCYLSHDLENWEGPFPVFRPPVHFWGTTQFWAPEVYRHQDRYLMLASFSDGRHRGTQTLVADAPTGPFRPAGNGPITPDGWDSLDGTLHFEDGRPWIVYCHEWTQIGDGRIVAQRFTADLARPIAEPVVLFAASSAPWTRPATRDNGSDGYVTDGPFLHRSSTGHLLMLWSSIGQDGYATGIARSASGRITGPWTHQESPLWSQDGGHGMLFAANGRLKLALHQPNDAPKERAVFIDVIDVGDTVVLAGTGPTSVDRPAPLADQENPR